MLLKTHTQIHTEIYYNRILRCLKTNLYLFRDITHFYQLLTPVIYCYVASKLI